MLWNKTKPNLGLALLPSTSLLAFLIENAIFYLQKEFAPFFILLNISECLKQTKKGTTICKLVNSSETLEFVFKMSFKKFHEYDKDFHLSFKISNDSR